jgi:hypothetical protein
VQRAFGRFTTAIICVLACALALAVPASGAKKVSFGPKPAPSVLDGNVMWIWIISQAEGGSPSAIAAKAKRYGFNTIIVKGADAGNYFRQLSPAFVQAMHAKGIKVCGYHFVYGNSPLTEAKVSARVARNSDCLLIDAEGQYEGKYRQAAAYMRSLRKQIGSSYPVGLAPFPYVHYHPGYPYSVFLGPGGAQFNLPQMYWRAIGVSPDRIFEITYQYNRIYKRPIFPLGQIYGDEGPPPPPSQIRRFHQLAQAYGATGVSWWDWHSSTAAGFAASGAPVAPLHSFTPKDQYPPLRRGISSDIVLWAQEHLASAGHAVRLTGSYGADTQQAVRAFQSEHGLPATGQFDAGTWRALLEFEPKAVSWKTRGPTFASRSHAASAHAADAAVARRPGR